MTTHNQRLPTISGPAETQDCRKWDATRNSGKPTTAFKPTSSIILEADYTSSQTKRIDRLRAEALSYKARLVKTRSKLRSEERNFRNQRRDTKQEALQGGIEPNPGEDVDWMADVKVWFGRDTFGRAGVSVYNKQPGTHTPRLVWGPRADVRDPDLYADDTEMAVNLTEYRHEPYTCSPREDVCFIALTSDRRDFKEGMLTFPGGSGRWTNKICVCPVPYVDGMSLDETVLELCDPDKYDESAQPSFQTAPVIELYETSVQYCHRGIWSPTTRFICPSVFAGSWLRILLILGGIEPNPGPQTKQPHKPKVFREPEWQEFFFGTAIPDRTKPLAVAGWKRHCTSAFDKYPESPELRKAAFVEMKRYQTDGTLARIETVEDLRALFEMSIDDAAERRHMAAKESPPQVQAAVELGLGKHLRPPLKISRPPKVATPRAESAPAEVAPLPADESRSSPQAPIPVNAPPRFETLGDLSIEPMIDEDDNSPPDDESAPLLPKPSPVVRSSRSSPSPPVPDPTRSGSTTPALPPIDPYDGHEEEWKRSRTDVLDGDHLSFHQRLRLLTALAWYHKNPLYFPWLVWTPFVTMEAFYKKKHYVGERRIAPHRTVNEQAFDMVVGTVKVEPRMRVVLALFILALVLIASSISTFTAALVKTAIGLYYIRPTLAAFTLMNWQSHLIRWSAKTAEVLGLVTWSSGSTWAGIYLLILIYNLQRIRLRFLPHAVSSVLAEFELRPSSAYDSPGIRQRLRRMACLPVAATEAVRCLDGSEMVVQALSSERDFYVGGSVMADLAASLLPSSGGVQALDGTARATGSARCLCDVLTRWTSRQVP